MAYARGREIAKASGLLLYVQQHTDPASSQSRSFSHLLEGELALAQGNAEKAVELLHLADRESTSAETIASLARACDMTGRKAEAVEYYEKLIAAGRASLGWEPQQEWISAHARLAEILLGDGEKAKADMVLRPLIDLWRAADPDLPLTVKLRNLAIKLPASVGYIPQKDR